MYLGSLALCHLGQVPYPLPSLRLSLHLSSQLLSVTGVRDRVGLGGKGAWLGAYARFLPQP